jgi:hypothetical protein
VKRILCSIATLPFASVLADAPKSKPIEAAKELA